MMSQYFGWSADVERAERLAMRSGRDNSAVRVICHRDEDDDDEAEEDDEEDATKLMSCGTRLTMSSTRD